MLQKNYSRAVIGRSYLSFLLGIELLREKNSVLILDDERLEYGDLFSYGLTSLDKSFLKTWGQDMEISCLENIDDFLVQKPFTLRIGQHSVFLGGDCWDNFRELYRKFPKLFPFGDFMGDSQIEESFRTAHEGLTKRLGKNGFRFKGLENSTIEFLLGQSPEIIKDTFHLFKSALKENEREGWQFLYFARSLFHKRFTSSASSVELFHFFLCLLSPHYYLKEQELTRELSKVFVDKGGHFKGTQVREWKFYKSVPWSMELASYEGIIHPHKISFLGSLPKGLPLKVVHQWKRYQSIHFEVSCQDARISGLDQQWFFWAEPDAMGTDAPFWRAQVDGGKIKGQVLYREKLGSKLPFITSAIEEQLLKEIDHWLPGTAPLLGSVDLNTGKEIYLDQSYTFKANSLPQVKEVKLFDYSSPFLKKKLKNVSYFGPLKGCPLGLFGQLLELRDHSKQA